MIIKRTRLKIKLTALLLGITVLLFSFYSASYAQNSRLSDIAGTPFYTPVTKLESAGIVAGYPDGTFRPFQSLSRAEAVTLVYRAYGSSSLALTSPYYFHDVAPGMWAASFIRYAAGAGVINGYPDGSFRPDAEITYNEVITLIVRARGFDTSSFSWPDGYLNAAAADGMLKDLYGISFPSDGNAPANRGNTAMLIASGSEYNPSASTGPQTDPLTDPDMNCICCGLMTSTMNGSDKLGNSCGWGRFLMGDTIYDILTSGSCPELYAGFNPAYGLLRVNLENGRAVTLDRITKSYYPALDYGLITPASQDGNLTEFCRVTSVDSSALSYHASASESGIITLTPHTVYYEISLKNNRIHADRISSADIRPEDMAAVYSIAGKGNADVVIIVHPDSVPDILHASAERDVMYMG